MRPRRKRDTSRCLQLASLQTDIDRRREEAAWRAAEAENTPKAYAEFREQFPDGVYAGGAKERRLRRADEIRQERENGLCLSTNEWLSIEQRLASLGFNPVDVNGKVGKNLRAAIHDYRRSRGMAAHDYVDKSSFVFR